MSYARVVKLAFVVLTVLMLIPTFYVNFSHNRKPSPLTSFSYRIKQSIETCLETATCDTPYKVVSCLSLTILAFSGTFSQQFSILQDDSIVVATDKKTGKKWMLGQVRRYAVHESWSPTNLIEEEPSEYPSYPKFYTKNDVFLDKDVIPTKTNRTQPNSEILIFNRVPKCGSSTMNEVLDHLSSINNFTHKSWNVYWMKQQNVDEEREFLSSVLDSKRPVAVDRHVYFLQSQDYSLERPSWVNVVRDPVDRFVSLFYFLRTPKRWLGKADKPPDEWFHKDLNNCIISGDLECQFNSDLKYLKEHQLTYFCGSSPECKVVGSRAALQKAKYNAEHYYSVIGVSSEIESSLAVMEAYLPKFFQGATHIYSRMGMLYRPVKSRFMRRLMSSNLPRPMPFRKNQTPNKKEISAKARAILKANMTLEYEFYDFVLQRLRLQKRAIGFLGKLVDRLGSFLPGSDNPGYQ